MSPITSSSLRLVTHRQTQDTYAQRRIADELYPPRIVQHWLSSKGTPVTNPQLLELLNSEYAKHETSQKFYADMNLRPNLWQEIEELVSPDTRKRWWNESMPVTGNNNRQPSANKPDSS